MPRPAGVTGDAKHGQHRALSISKYMVIRKTAEINQMIVLCNPAGNEMKVLRGST